MIDREVDGQHVFSLIFLRHFRWMADREVDGPVWVVLCRSWGLCVRSWAALGPMLAVLDRSWALCWRSWAALGPYVGGLGRLLGPM